MSFCLKLYTSKVDSLDIENADAKKNVGSFYL